MWNNRALPNNGRPANHTAGGRFAARQAGANCGINPKQKEGVSIMAELTDADQKAFIDKIIGTLQDAGTKQRLIAKDWDPTQRTTNLVNGVGSVTGDEGVISNLEAALSTAVATRRRDLDNNYDLASATVSSIEGALGKDDQLVKDLRQFRGSLNRGSSAEKKPAGGAT
jgi:hypothetical protein